MPGHYASFAYSDPFADPSSLSLFGGRILDDSEDDTEQEEGGPPELTTAQLAKLRELVKNMPRFYGADESGMTATGSTDPSGMEGADVEAAYTNYFEELKAYNATINQFLEDEGIPRFYKDDKGDTYYLNIGDAGQPSSFTDMYWTGEYDPQSKPGNYIQEGAVGLYGTRFDELAEFNESSFAAGLKTIAAAVVGQQLGGLLGDALGGLVGAEAGGASVGVSLGSFEGEDEDVLSEEGINPYLAYLTGKTLSEEEDEEEEETTTVDATQGFLNTLNTAEEALQDSNDEVTTATEALQQSNESYDEAIEKYQESLEYYKKNYGFRAKNMYGYKRAEQLKKQAEIDKQTEATKLRQTIAAAITERDNARKAASNAEREYNEAVKLKQAEDIRQSQQDARDKIAGEKAAAEYSKALRQSQITATENTIKSNLPAYASSEEEIVDKLGERLYQSGMSLEQFIEAAYDIAFAGLRPDQISNAQRQKVRDIASSAYERVPKTTIVDVTEVTDDPVSEIIADADSSITEVEPTPETTLEDTTEPTETTVAFEDFEEPEFELDIEDPFITEPTESLLESTASSDPSTEVTEVTIDEDPLLASTEELEVEPVEVEEPETEVAETTTSSIPTVLEILSGTSGSIGGLGGSTGGAGMLGGSPEEGTVGTTTEDIVSGLEDSSVDPVGTTTTTGDTGVGSGTETIGTDVTEGIGTTTGTGVSEVGTTTGTGTGAGVGAGAGAGTGVGTTAGVETGAGVGTGTGVATGTGETSVPMAETGTGTTVETTEETDFSDIGEEAEESIFEDTTGETVEEVLEEAEEVLERTEEETTEAEETEATGEESAASGEGEATGEGTGTGQGSGAGEGLGAGLGAGLGLGLGIGLLRPGGVTQSLFKDFKFTPAYQAPELLDPLPQVETPNFLQGLFRDVA